jgi:hypothetical protein
MVLVDMGSVSSLFGNTGGWYSSSFLGGSGGGPGNQISNPNALHVGAGNDHKSTTGEFFQMWCFSSLTKISPFSIIF